MDVKVNLPTNLGGITVGQYQKYSKLLAERDKLSERKFADRLVSIITDIPPRRVKDLAADSYETVINQFSEAIQTPAEFTPTFKLNGQEFGFIPNFDNISMGEFADLNTYEADDVSSYHKLMAILFRPIKNKDYTGKTYEIEPYKGTDKYAELMRSAPFSALDGALVFFCQIMNELKANTLKYSAQQMTAEIWSQANDRLPPEIVDILKNGVTMPR